MNGEELLRAVSREVLYLVVLRLDYCGLTYGQAPCQASGEPVCYYTYPTCKDPANYARGEKEYWFSLAEGFSVPGALPLLANIKSVPTEIKPEDHVTRRARFTLEFLDDSPLALANPDKAVSNQESERTFFRNLMARNPNARGRVVEIRRGFPGTAPSEFRILFRGVIDSMRWREGRFELVVKDQLKLLDRKLPPEQSSDNALTAAYSGGETMEVSDGSEFQPPGAVKVDDEYITFTGVEGNTLTGCSPGRFGSQPAVHPAGRAVRQVAVFAEPEDGEGLPPDEIFLSLLCTYGGIEPLAIAVRNRGATLTAGISASELTIPVSLTEAFPETGVVRIGSELIRYRGLSGLNLLAAERGAYGTEPASHQPGDPVLITAFSDELGRWMAGTRFRRFVERTQPLKRLVNQLRAESLVHIWQAEDSTISAKCLAPPFYTEKPKELDDETSFIDGSTSWEPGDELRASRIAVYYGAVKPDPSEEPEDYAGLLIIADQDAERPEFYGEVRRKEIKAKWIYREHEALLLASRWLIRYRDGAARFKFALELKDDDLQVGDLARITSRDVIDPSGSPRRNALFEVIKKQRVSDNRIEFTAMDTRLDKRYPVISPADFSMEYDEAGEEEREKYGWVGDAENKVGAGGEDGYYIY